MKIRLITINGIEFAPKDTMPLFDLSVLQSSQLYCYCTLNFKMTKLRKPIYLRYSLGGSRPRQTTKFRRSSRIKDPSLK